MMLKAMYLYLNLKILLSSLHESRWNEHYHDSCHEQGGCRIHSLLVSMSDV